MRKKKENPRPVLKKKEKRALLELGFGDNEAVEYLTRHTQEKVTKNIQDLKDAGLKDPVKLIEKFPPLAGLDIQRVEGRLKLTQTD